MPDIRSPDRLLDGLNDAQREAVAVTSGPLAIIAGAGSGKTRVISHRAAYAIETGVVAADRILLVTFTDKAATEMVERMRTLGHRGVMAKTFHAHALAQLRTFWPSRHEGAPMPGILESQLRLLYPIARRLPGGYAFTQARDLADAISWAKVRRIPPERWLAEGGDRAPIPAELFARAYEDYERTKARTGVIDFDDMLIETVDLLESDAQAAELVRSRKTWISVDEYQDTNPLAGRLLELWLGESRDIGVVGDPDQTIYTFTGASSDFLTTFAARHPGAREVSLTDNYRSSPEIITLANRLLASGGRARGLVATQPTGPTPSIQPCADDTVELEHLIATIRRLVGEGIAAAEIAILVRLNAQIPPIEAALTKARIPFVVRGQRFFERPEVRQAIQLVRKLPGDIVGSQLIAAFGASLRVNLGFEGDDAQPKDRVGPGGAEARERQAGLSLLREIAEDAVNANHDTNRDALLADLESRAAAESEGGANGVNLLTLHRAKGLEWDAVILPGLEDGTLPIRQAESDDELAEERRLLYVGLTRARRQLSLSWARRRSSAGGRGGTRYPSPFLLALQDPAARRVTELPGAPIAKPRRARDEDSPLMAALREWRLTAARSDGVPAYVIAPDSLLLAITDERPTTIAALGRVKGMGPSRLARYGEEMLEITRAQA